ncbi:MAG: hypothetical protein AAB316_09580 [Bacteroidota bacterium]
MRTNTLAFFLFAVFTCCISRHLSAQILHGTNPEKRVAALASTVPDAFAKGYLGTVGGGLTFQHKTRLGSADANVALSAGLGNPEKLIGVDLRLNIYGTGSSTGAPGNFGEGTLELHLSRMVSKRFWVGAGVHDLVGWRQEPPNKLNSIYLTGTTVLSLKKDENSAFAFCYLTAGVGNGRYRTDEKYTLEEESPFGVFGSAAVQVLPQGNFIVEWTGYNMFTGVSVFPFKKFPGQIVIGVDDLLEKQKRFVVAISGGLHFFKHKNSTYRFLSVPPPPAPQTSRI